MKEITIEMVRKMKFVQDHVEPMVRRLDPSITAAAYTYDHATGDEYVTVVRNSGAENVCVSADSMAQLAVDVIKEVFLS
jgi:hypothetical protein